MKLPTKLVAVKKINSEVARSQFPAEDIEQAAQLIIAVEGVINPIILKRTSLDAYEVAEGHFEYYAAVRAREINPLKGEMIQAIILEPDNEKAILAQVDCLRSPSTQSSSDVKPNNSAESSTSSIQGDFEFRLINLEKIFQSQFEELRQDNRKLESQIKELQKNINQANVQSQPDQNQIIDQIVGRITTVIEQLPRSSSGKTSRKKTLEELKQNPVNLNTASVAELCTVDQIAEARANKIIKWREDKGSFTSVVQLRELFSPKLFEDNHWDECFTVES